MTNQNTLRIRQTRRKAAGFSLVEILIALGIFLIGMISVVSLFPAAAVLQRETNQEVIGGLAAQSAAAIIDANRLTYTPGTPSTGDLAGYHANSSSTEARALPLRNVMNTNDFDAQFPFTVRSYPTGLIDTTAGNAFDQIKACDLHWVPFIQDIGGSGSNPNWVMRLFVVESDSRADYSVITNSANPNDPDNFPKVRAVDIDSISNDAGTETYTFNLGDPTDLEPSDIVMDSNGNAHVVTGVDNDGDVINVLNAIPAFPVSPPGSLWYTPRGGASNSPARRVVTVSVDVVKP